MRHWYILSNDPMSCFPLGVASDEYRSFSLYCYLGNGGSYPHIAGMTFSPNDYSPRRDDPPSRLPSLSTIRSVDSAGQGKVLVMKPSHLH